MRERLCTCLLNQLRTALNADKLHLRVCLCGGDSPGTRSRSNIQDTPDCRTISLFSKCLPALLEGRQIEVEQAWQRSSPDQTPVDRGIAANCRPGNSRLGRVLKGEEQFA